jgi:hypothetical protein
MLKWRVGSMAVDCNDVSETEIVLEEVCFETFVAFHPPLSSPTF